MKKIISISLFASIFAFSPIIARGLGLSVSPGSVSIKLVPGEESETVLTVSNPSKEVALVEAYVEEFEERIYVYPARFVLEAGEYREIQVKTRAKTEEIYKTSIAIVASPLGNLFAGVSGGVKVPFTVQISEGKSLMAGAVLGIKTGTWISVLLVGLAVISGVFLAGFSWPKSMRIRGLAGILKK